MTTPPYQPGQYGQPNQDPYGQGGGFGQQRPPSYGGQPPYGGQYGTGNEQTQQIGGGGQPPVPPQQPQGPYGGQYGAQPQPPTQQWQGVGGTGYGGLTPPPEPPRKTGMIVAIIVVAVLVLAGAGVGLYFAMKDDGSGNQASPDTTTSAPDETGSSQDEKTTTEETTTEETEEPGAAIDAQPGDCIKVNVASSTNADVETVDCGTDEAIYKVATREETDTGSCPNDQYVSYTEEGQLLLCLQLNVKKGDCLEVTETEDKRAECGGPTATHTVLDVLDGVDDETQCADPTTEVITYPQPALTICLGEAAA